MLFYQKTSTLKLIYIHFFKKQYIHYQLFMKIIKFTKIHKVLFLSLFEDESCCIFVS